MDLVFDPAIALFAGLNVVPKRSYLAAYSSRVDHCANVRLMDAWFEQLEGAGLPHGDSLDLDFHTVPAHTTTEPLEKHYVSSRSRRQQASWSFWPATPNSACSATPTPAFPKRSSLTRFCGSSSSGNATREPGRRN